MPKFKDDEAAIGAPFCPASRTYSLLFRACVLIVGGVLRQTQATGQDYLSSAFSETEQFARGEQYWSAAMHRPSVAEHFRP